MRINIKAFLKKSAKPIAYVVLSLLVIVATIYFGKCYVTDGNNLNFTPEDTYILFLFGVGVILVSVILIRLTIRVRKLENALVDVFKEISDVEDNNIRFGRITQELILDLSCKFGVDLIEKKS